MDLILFLKEQQLLSRSFISAVKSQDKKLMNELLEKGVHPICYDEEGVPAIVTAARNGFTQGVNFLLEKGVPVDIASHAGETALTVAARNGDNETVMLLLEAGAERKSRGCYQNSALYYAAEAGHAQTAAILLDENDFFAIEEAHRIAQKNNYQDIVTLLETGKLPNKQQDIKTQHQLSLNNELLKALHENDEQRAFSLVARGADVNTREAERVCHSALGLAIMNNHQELAKHLINKGADVNYTDKNGFAPLDTAVYCKQKEIVQLLLEKGATIVNKNNLSASDVAFDLISRATSPEEEQLLIEIAKILHQSQITSIAHKRNTIQKGAGRQNAE